MYCGNKEKYERRNFFVITNPRKVEDYNRRIQSERYVFVHRPVELNEKQSFGVFAVSKSKIEHAKNIFPGKKILVEDSGFLFEGFKYD